MNHPETLSGPVLASHMRSWPSFSILILALLLAGLFMATTGCAGKEPHPLLKETPTAMTDAGLLRYYYDLGEAIDECEGGSDGGPDVGVGGHTGTSGSGVGVVIGFPMGSGCDATDLRQRRAEVSVLLNQRGLTP